MIVRAAAAAESESTVGRSRLAAFCGRRRLGAALCLCTFAADFSIIDESRATRRDSRELRPAAPEMDEVI